MAPAGCPGKETRVGPLPPEPDTSMSETLCLALLLSQDSFPELRGTGVRSRMEAWLYTYASWHSCWPAFP